MRDETDFNQGELDFAGGGSDEGFRKWRREAEERQRAFEARHGIVLGRRARVQLRGENSPLEGVIRMVPKQPKGTPAQLRLTVGPREFVVAQIESVVALD